MCFVVVPLSTIRRVCGAAQNVQTLLTDGTLAEAFNKDSSTNAKALATTAFDVLEEGTARLVADVKEVSPFMRYRNEIMGHYSTAANLRALVMNLWGGQPVRLGHLFMNADEHHTRIALECIASYTQRGENDLAFMAMADEIKQRNKNDQEEAA